MGREEGDSDDDTWPRMQEALATLEGFASVQALKKDFGPLPGGGGGQGEGRHAVDVQLLRRVRGRPLTIDQIHAIIL